MLGSRHAPRRSLPSAAAVEEDLWGDENGRRLYLVERDLRGLPPAQLVSVHRVLGEAVRREVPAGGQVRYGPSR